MEAVIPDKEITGLTIADLWIELRIAHGSAPGRSQFYEWLKAAWIHRPMKRGGIKAKQTYNEFDLNRLKRLHELKTELGSLQAAKEHLKTEILQNPELYGD
ncbi:hypothetical protein [Leptolyngbya ohadii]|uniref:hypothetical protein n=1 Tax=Leptolyngbya ohadii TaxID=1962290 RepID=UPI000B59A731|nr:hypothetical protein [Leptolyngbya ohadii]